MTIPTHIWNTAYELINAHWDRYTIMDSLDGEFDLDEILYHELDDRVAEYCDSRDVS